MDQFEQLSSSLIKNENIYTNVQELKKNFVKVENLDLDYFLKLFYYLLACNSFLLVTFILKNSFNFILKILKAFKLIMKSLFVKLKFFAYQLIKKITDLIVSSYRKLQNK